VWSAVPTTWQYQGPTKKEEEERRRAKKKKSRREKERPPPSGFYTEPETSVAMSQQHAQQQQLQQQQQRLQQQRLQQQQQLARLPPAVRFVRILESALPPDKIVILKQTLSLRTVRVNVRAFSNVRAAVLGRALAVFGTRVGHCLVCTANFTERFGRCRRRKSPMRTPCNGCTPWPAKSSRTRS
jgi:hypothetical protein